MTDDPRRRRLMRQGFVFLLLALVLGLAIGALPHPSRWLAAHLTAFLTGLILVVIALAWNELRLTNGQRTLAYATGLVAAYGGLVGNVFGALTDLPDRTVNSTGSPCPERREYQPSLLNGVPTAVVMMVRDRHRRFGRLRR
jgi:hypothetical protein